MKPQHHQGISLHHHHSIIYTLILRHTTASTKHKTEFPLHIMKLQHADDIMLTQVFLDTTTTTFYTQSINHTTKINYLNIYSPLPQHLIPFIHTTTYNNNNKESLHFYPNFTTTYTNTPPGREHRSHWQ